MPNKAKQKKTPELRFPEFSREWEQKKLEDVVLKFSTGLNPRNNFILGSGKNYYVTIKNIKNGSLDFNSCEKINNRALLKINRRSNLSKNDIIIASIGNIGDAFLVQNNPKNWNINESVFSIKPITKAINPKFLYYLIISNSTKKYFTNKLTGSSFKSLKIKDLKLTPIFKPLIEEQQKIADFLTKVDEWIDNLKQQKERLEDWKKGLMQKIFNQEIRFKDNNGNYFPDWEEKKLEEYIKPKSKKNKGGEFDLVLSVNNEKGFIPQAEQFEDHRVASKDTTNYKIVEKGEFSYNPSRINVGSIALLKNFDAGIVSPMYVVFQVLKNLNSNFLSYLIETHKFKYLVKAYSSGSVRQTLNFKDLSNFKLMIPSLSEQQKIAEFLTSIDSLIRQKEQQTSEVKTWKKGLIQKMFV